MKNQKLIRSAECLLAGVLATASLFGFASCGKNKGTESGSDSGSGASSSSDVPSETYESKWIDGIAPVFDESLGYTNENPSAFQEGATRWLYYTRNTGKYESSTEIAVRKGSYKGGAWTYGDYTVCVTPSESGWDSAHVFGADVVKGNFAYNGTTYSYLMAYSGNSSTKDLKNASIGLAVSQTPDGEWIKVGTQPLVAFDSTEWDSTGLLSYTGDIEPSLVSYDGESKLWLFYEESEVFKSNYVLEIDAADLGNVRLGGRKVVETSGVSDLGISNPLLYGADIVWDKDAGELIAVRETTVTVTTDPKIADELQILKSSDDVLYEIKQDWTGREESVEKWWSAIGSKIDGDSTAVWDENKTGYSRLFSPCIVSDPYGRLLEYGSLDILFSSKGVSGDTRAERDDAWAYSGMIHTLTVTY